MPWVDRAATTPSSTGRFGHLRSLVVRDADHGWLLQRHGDGHRQCGRVRKHLVPLDVSPAGGCGAIANGTDLTIPDPSTVEDTMSISGCSGNASATSTVEVHIVHTYNGDLVVTLVALTPAPMCCTTGPAEVPTTSTPRTR